MKKHLLFLLLYALTICSYGQVTKYSLEKIINAAVYFPEDITTDVEGNFYIIDYGQITKFTSEGNYLAKFSTSVNGDYENPSSIALDKEGNIYVVNYSSSTVRKFDKSGNLLLQFGSYGSENGQLRYALGLAVDAAGNIYVADTENNRIQKFSNSGTFLMQIGSTGTSAGQFIRPNDMAIDAAGNIYVTDSGNHRIQKFDSKGQLLLVIGSEGWDRVQFQNPCSIAVATNGNIYVSDTERRFITKLSAKGEFISQLGRNNLEEDYYFDGTKTTIALDASGNVYVADRRHHGDSYVHKFNTNDQSVAKMCTWSKEDGKFNHPRGVAVDAAGNFYIADTNNNRIQKFSASGQFISKFGASFLEGGPLLHTLLAGIAVDISGNIYTLESSDSQSQVLKFDASGKLIKNFDNISNGLGYTGIAVDIAGNIYLSEYYGGCIRKISADGLTSIKIGTWGKEGNGQLFVPLNVAVDKKGNIYALDSNGHRIQKFNSAGQFIKQHGGYEDPYVTSAGIAIDDKGFVYVAAGSDGFIQVFDSLLQPVEKIRMSAHRVAVNRKGNKIVAIEYYQDAAFMFSTGEITKENFITGTVFQDNNATCKKESEEKGISGIIVSAAPGPYYGVSDANGNYSIAVDTGSYTVQQLLPEQHGRTILQNCHSVTAAHTARFTTYSNTISEKDFGNKVSVSPYLSAHVTSNRRRRCFTNNTTVNYTNTGFAEAANVKVYVQLPEYVVFKSADKPYTRDASGNYVFDIGSLAANQTGTIAIQDSVVCNDPNIRGLSQCTKAWITPANSYPASQNWDKSDIRVEARCLENGMVRFAIKNTGEGNMADSLDLRIFLDAKLALSHQFKLPKGDSLVLRVPANGRTVRLEADQHVHHPVKLMAHATIEACGVNANGRVSMGYVSVFPVDDAQPEVSVDCQPIIDSFDPNDKGVVPAGLTSEKFTPTNTALDYLIRFQNTGTDVAYRVVVVDTLSSNLDLATLQMGSVSHPYQLSVSGKINPVLTWTFNNINLPDSTRDQLGSNGYLSFSIKPKTNLPEKEKIENFADIFFDYNEPVRTNTVINRIYDMPYEPTALQLDPDKVIVSPVIGQFFPSEGRYGTLVTLSGKNFSATADRNIVRFNNTVAQIIQASTETIVVRVPQGSSTGKVSIQTPDGSKQSSMDFTVSQPPVITEISPNEIKAGDLTGITIRGHHFATDLTKDTITFNGLQARIISARQTELVVIAPGNATTGKIWLGTLGGQTESTQDFVVWYPPLISSISADTVRMGTMVTITGQNFAPAKERNVVTFGEAMGLVKAASATTLQVQIPSGAQTSYVAIKTPGGIAISEKKIVVIPQPAITDFTPKQGTISTKVTVHGKNFNAFSTQDTLYLGNILTTIEQRRDTLMVISIPKGAETGKFSIFGLGGKAISEGDFIVEKLSLDESISLYPNPSKGVFTLDFSKADFYAQNIRIYNAIGKLVSEKSIAPPHDDKLFFELPSYFKGMYMMLIDTDKGTITKKLALQ